jgi:nucleotide-binding universal stress UspA family protein
LESAKADAKRHLEEVTNHLRDAGYHVSYRIEVGDPVENITRVANELDVDMIAMSTHGRSGLSRLIFGSVTSGVLKAAQRPVLVIPSNYAQRQEEREVSELNFG